MEEVILHAKTCCKCGVKKSQIEFGPNRAASDGLQTACRPCKAEYQRIGRKLRPDQSRKHSRAYYAKHRDAQVERARKYYAENGEKARAASKRWKMKNVDKVFTYKRARYQPHPRLYPPKDHDAPRRANRKWKKLNHHALIADRAYRRAKEMLATPPWADRKEIAKIYAMARELSMRTGVRHHVDHDIPLRHETVCGLHVHENLQAIPAQHNLVKSNKFPYCSIGASKNG